MFLALPVAKNEILGKIALRVLVSVKKKIKRIKIISEDCSK